jgi:hypothetical protein
MNDPTWKAPEDPTTAGRATPPADAPEHARRAGPPSRPDDDGAPAQLGEDPGTLDPADDA